MLREHEDHVVSVPKDIATCPYCGSDLWAEVHAWVDGEPNITEIGICCNDDERALSEAYNPPEGCETDYEPHRYTQSEWGPVVEVVKAWVMKANAP